MVIPKLFIKIKFYCITSLPKLGRKYRGTAKVWTSDQSFRYDWRLSYANLKNNSKLDNTIGQKERNKIWIPSLVFDNSQKDSYIKNDALSTLSVKLVGLSELKINSDLQEYEGFSGSSNPLVYARNFELILDCEFELHYYPFDTQQCYIVVRD